MFKGHRDYSHSLLTFSFFNLFIVSCLGLLLRSFPFLSSFPLSFKNLVHGHSHFAFGGWVMPVLVWMILVFFPELKDRMGQKHLRNIIVLILISAYGMLLSFPFQGYGPVSIIFSTLSIVASCYLAIMVWKHTRTEKQATSVKFLRAGLFYLVLSSAGPFATGPIMAMGKAGTPLFFNAIYFYLHFQYNGWFTFAVLSIFYRIIEKNGMPGKGRMVFHALNTACLPAYFLSTLWSHPPVLFYYLGGMAALLQVASLPFLVKDARYFKGRNTFLNGLFTLSLIAFAFKNLLQLAGAFPSVADMAYHSHNFIIAYLHLVLLGFISLFAISIMMRYSGGNMISNFKWPLLLFLTALAITEILLAAQASNLLSGFLFTDYFALLFGFSCLFPLSFLWLFRLVVKTPANAFFTAKPPGTLSNARDIFV